MVSTRFLYRLLGKILISITILLILFNEFIVYKIDQSFWNRIECSTANCTRILLVADPQILGEESDKAFYTNLAISDSDRYLKKTFQRAVQFSQPHITCFLGDLLDEGSIATTDEFKSYVQRFENIFYVDSSIKVVHIPGDNDIGGENGKYISNANLRRFEVEFMNDDILDYEEKIRFFKVNRMLMDYTNPDKPNNKNRLRFGLSHMPVLSAGGPLLRNFLRDVDPHIVFSAHWHESKIFYYPSFNYYEFYDKTVETFDLERLKNEHQYVEIMVPTASYRMGKYKIGYGMAILENSTLKYTVLWTLSRFLFLKLYLAWICISFILVLILHFGLRCPSRHFKRQYYGRISHIPHF